MDPHEISLHTRRVIMRLGIGVLWTVCVFAVTPAHGLDQVRNSVVKIYSTRRDPDFVRPWSKASAREISGSGVIVEGKRILTNAHVVTYAYQILVQGNESTEKVHARVVAIAPETDLALLKLDDESLFRTRAPLPLSESIPTVKDHVSVYGFPIGGAQLAVTEGIVSRIEFTQFYYFGSGLRIQIDAALNPGNSGGPAISNGKIVGLVFSKMVQAENIGYLVAGEEIAAFLKGIAAGPYQGKPALYDYFQTTENDALRGRLKLAGDVGGVMVSEVHRADPSSYPLRKWDVVTHIGPHALDREGNVRVKDDLRLSFRYFVAKLARHGTVPLTILREGKSLAVEVPVLSDPHLLVPFLRGKYPAFFVYGPMVFSPATQELLSQLGDRGLGALAMRKNPLAGGVLDPRTSDSDELVLLGPAFLPHKITQGYGPPLFGAVQRINGTKVKNLVHAAELLRDATGEYVTIDLSGRQEIYVFRREELARSTEEILADEGIRNQCSEELRPVWTRGKK
jgi:S1-C subfamily serine protease